MIIFCICRKPPFTLSKLKVNMELWKSFVALLISWNALVMVLLLWRQERTIIEDSRVRMTIKASTLALKTPRVGTRDLLMKISRQEHLNVPDIYFQPNNSDRGLHFPDTEDIHFSNVYWQVLVAEGATFYLFGAYYDCRKSKEGSCYVRILGMVDTFPPPTSIRCALWYSGGQKLVWANQNISFDHLWRKYWENTNNRTLQPYLISCIVPKNMSEDNKPVGAAIPEMVSLVSTDSFERDLKPSTNLKVNYVDEAVDKKDFVVCVKGLDFPGVDISRRLLEWVHLVKLLGADKIVFYELEVHPNVAVTLNYMESRQMAEVIPLTLPGHQPNLAMLRNLYLKKMKGQKRLNEIIPYNDCLYRNLNLYKYILLLDIDEVIMPTSSLHWKGLMEQIQSIVQLYMPKEYKAASYSIQNVYFFDDLHDAKAEESVPEYLYMTRHVVRSAEFTDKMSFVKCFHDISIVKALHNHYPLSCLPGILCTFYNVSPLMAQLQHYRRECQELMQEDDCLAKFKNKTIVDRSIWRYKTQLEQLVYDDIQRLEQLLI